MPKQIFGAESVVTTLNRAFNDTSPSNATYNNQVAAAGTTTDSQMAFAKQYGAGYAGQTADALSTLILGNLGVLPNAALQTALKDYITAAGVSNIGIIALQLGDILSGLENATGDQAGFKAAAVAWNNEVTASYNYSSNAANTAPSGPGVPTTPGATFTLAAGAEVFGPNQGDVKFKSTSGDDTFIAAAATLDSTDVIDGGTGTDTLKATLNGTSVTPTLTSIENVVASVGATDGKLALNGNADVKNVSVTGTIENGKAVTITDIKLGTATGLTSVVAGKAGAEAATVEFAFKAATGSSDAATITLNGSKGFDATSFLTVKADAIENLTLSTATADSAIILSGAQVKTLTITGDKALTISTFSTAALTAIDASAAKGNLTLGSVGTEATVTLGQGADTVTLGAGKQTVVYNTTNLSKLAAADTVNTFVTTEDKIDLKAFGLSSLKVDAVLAGTTRPAGEFADFFKSGGNSYAVSYVADGANSALYVDVNKDGSFNTATDLVIKLGAATTVAATDFIFA